MDRQREKKTFQESSDQIKIVGQMALCNFPFWERCLKSLVRKVDELYLRFDDINGDREIFNKLDKVCGKKLKDVYIGKSEWNKIVWREEMIRMLDSVKPDIVISYDEDEEIGSIKQDLKDFLNTNHTQMALEYEYPMPTIDGRKLPIDKSYPSKPHVIAIRWKPNLTFTPYIGRKRITQYGKKYFLGKTKILHYCYYTPELEKKKFSIVSKRTEKTWEKRIIESLTPYKEINKNSKDLVYRYKTQVNIKKYGRRSIFHSELYLFWVIAKGIKVNRIIESGTYHGFTTNNLARLFPECKIITYEYKKKYWKKAKKRCHPSIEVILGKLDRRKLTKKTAVLIDGPKGKEAIELAESIIDKVAMVGLHDMDRYIGLLKEKFGKVIHSGKPEKRVKKLDKYIKRKVKVYNKKYYGRVLACIMKGEKNDSN